MNAMRCYPNTIYLYLEQKHKKNKKIFREPETKLPVLYACKIRLFHFLINIRRRKSLIFLSEIGSFAYGANRKISGIL